MYYILSPWPERLSYGLHCLILRLLVRPFLGMVGESDTPPIKFTRPLEELASLLGFLVLQGA